MKALTKKKLWCTFNLYTLTDWFRPIPATSSVTVPYQGLPITGIGISIRISVGVGADQVIARLAGVGGSGVVVGAGELGLEVSGVRWRAAVDNCEEIVISLNYCGPFSCAN